MVYINSHNLREIQVKKLAGDLELPNNGIRNLKMSTSRALLVTTGIQKDEVAIYQLPSYKPLVLTVV